MAFIALTRGLFARVDDEQFASLSKFKWHALRTGTHRFYAARSVIEGGKKRTVLMHAVVAQTPSGSVTDHINRDTLDNRRENLRVCTARENGANKSRYPNNSTGHKGVTQSHCKSKPFRASICIGGKSKNLGYFSNIETASAAYNKAARDAFGIFACENAS